jgi:hypothetical protein
VKWGGDKYEAKKCWKEKNNINKVKDNLKLSIMCDAFSLGYPISTTNDDHLHRCQLNHKFHQRQATNIQVLKIRLIICHISISDLNLFKFILNTAIYRHKCNARRSDS